VSEAERLLLSHIGDVHHGRNLTSQFQQFCLAALLETPLQLGAHVEMILDRRLAAAGDNDDLVDAGGQRLFDAVLDQRLVHQGEHLLGDGLGCRQETCAKTGSRKDCLVNFFAHDFLGALRGYATLA